MTTIIIIFSIACFLSLVLTPLVTNFAYKFNIVDMPSERKVHEKPVPRIGGLAIYLAFYLTFIPLLFHYFVERSDVLAGILMEPRLIYIALGSCIAFALGLYDDRRGLRAHIKFGVQIIAALVVYMGGIKITSIVLPGMAPIHFGWLSLPVTVFWILLVINSINLIDGLDGLAAGVSFFVCVVLVILCVVGDHIIIGVLLAALAGSILGFLRYNFNPATIFMGDSGSYFLGYMLAVLSILGSIKSQFAMTLLIPVIALGVPLMDTVWSTVRRFLLGKRLFQADKGHFHHKLLGLGLSHRTAVLVLYGITILMGLFALALVNLRDERVALIFLMIGIMVIIGIRKLGYFDYLKTDRLTGWFRDLSDEAGISRDRRSFLNIQIKISESMDMVTLWKNSTTAFALLEFDIAALYLNQPNSGDGLLTEESGRERRKTRALASSICQREAPPDYTWTCPLDDDFDEVCRRCSLRIELELSVNSKRSFGSIVLLKDVRRGSMGHYTLKRVEHLRRNIISALENIEQASLFG